MPKKINIKGVIIPNSYKWFFDWFDMDSTCPNDVENVLNDANGEDIEVYINSPGGIIDVGSEIYTMLRAYKGDVKQYIVGEACSAASIIAMARYCEMSPTALMMVHCASTSGGGNHNDFEHIAGVLKTADEALSSAYMAKAGMTKEEAIAMMEAETWLTAEQAKEKGLIDAIMFEDTQPLRLTASTFALPSQEQMEKVKNIIAQANKLEENPLKEFFADRCTINNAEKAPASLLYEAFLNWCEETGEKPISQKKFGGILAEQGFESKRGTGGPYWWHGVGVNKVNHDEESSPSFTTDILKAKLNLLKLKGEVR